MTRAQAWTLWVSTLAAAVTGAAYAAFRYLLDDDDPFTAFNHPLQPWALDGHIVLVPVLVFATGWVFAGHVLPRLADTPARRVSGIALIALFALMVGSGYVLQVSSEPALRAALAWTHGVAGALWTAAFVFHAWTGHGFRRSR